MNAPTAAASGERELAGLHVVVTGASGELGSVVATLLHARGAACHLPVRSPIRERGFAEMHVVEGVDLADERAVTAFYRDLPPLWASVHCAGAFDASPIAQVGLEHLRRMLHTNALSSFLCSREAVGRMRAGAKGGRIVNVLARQALEPERGAGLVAYTMSKAATAALTRALAAEVAGEGIRVTAVVPSILDTPKNRAAMPTADFASWVKLDDVAREIQKLVSPSSDPAPGHFARIYGASV